MLNRRGVTIAIPNWNHEVLLPRSISSALRAAAVLRARSIPAEVLVIDDCSRDGSPTMLRQLEALYCNDGLRVLAFSANGGLVASRNQALANARFRYITFLDADNELIPENLPCLITALEQTGAAAAYGNLLVRRQSSRSAHKVISNESIQRRIFRGNYVDAFAVFDRYQALDSGGYETTHPTWADLEMWLHHATSGRQIVFVPVSLGYYYVLQGSMLEENLNREWESQIYMKRVFDNEGCREFMALRTNELRFHPDVGCL
jgi:teichuronic acid biosynthesis glycosyltransferase TuaG